MTDLLLYEQKCILVPIVSVPMIDAIIERHVQFLKDPEVVRYLNVPDASVEYQRKKLLETIRSSTQCAMAVLWGIDDWIIEKIESRYIGMATLRDIDEHNQAAHSGSMIGDRSLWGMGFGKETKLLQLYHTFVTKGLRWVYSRTVRPNIASVRMLIASGYVQQGVRPDCRRIGNNFHDEILFGVNGEQWKAIWNRRALTRI